MSEKKGLCDCELQVVTQKNPLPKKCHCIVMHSMIVSKNRMILNKKCVRSICCICLKHPILRKALKFQKEKKEFDKKELTLFLIKQFKWEKVYII